ncbi:MAG: pyridoxamine 5'-phosphate oxidase family protein [Anaerolineae bacterium]|nr:pyridoxamine 5'-phosphate oxidase family protein [Anaerolineae bacterium]
MQTTSFSEIAESFIERVHQMVWCNVATVDRHGRPRSRVLHPIWELVDGGAIGWIATGRHTLKTKHLAARPYLSIAYIADPLKPIYAECHAEWADDPATKERIWNWLKETPPPLGYDNGLFWGTVENPAFGVLKLTPWRVELADLFGDTAVWQP